MSDIYWIIPAYFTIGLAFVESIRWARTKWKIVPLDKTATGLVFACWPFIIFLALVLAWRKKS